MGGRAPANWLSPQTTAGTVAQDPLAFAEGVQIAARHPSVRGAERGIAEGSAALAGRRLIRLIVCFGIIVGHTPFLPRTSSMLIAPSASKHVMSKQLRRTVRYRKPPCIKLSPFDQLEFEHPPCLDEVKLSQQSPSFIH